MDYLTPALIGIGLSMDCFAVSLAMGTTTKTRLVYAAAVIAACFGIFQAGMTLAGWAAGSTFVSLISAYDHWIRVPASRHHRCQDDCGRYPG